jgi:hypothetical protein
VKKGVWEQTIGPDCKWWAISGSWETDGPRIVVEVNGMVVDSRVPRADGKKRICRDITGCGRSGSKASDCGSEK